MIPMTRATGHSWSQTTPARASTLALLLIASTLVVMTGSVVAPVLEVIRSDLEVSGTEAGLIVTAHSLAIAVSSPLMGKLTDRLGVRPLLAAGLALYGIAGGAGLLAASYPALIASRLFFGIGAAAVFSTTTTALLIFYQGQLKDRVMGWRTTATSVGGMVWPLLGGALGGHSWHAPFAIYLVGIPLAIATLAVLPPARPGRKTPSGGHGLAQLLMHNPALLSVYGMLMASAVFMYVVIIFVPQRLATLGVHEPFLVAIYSVTTCSATMSLVGLAYGRLRARLRYRTLLRLAAAAWIIAFVVMGTASQPPILLAAPVLFGMGQALAIPLLTSLVGASVAPQQRGSATSMIGTAVCTGQFLSPLLIGPVIAATSVTTGFLITAGIACLILVALKVRPSVLEHRKTTSGRDRSRV